MPLPSCLCLGYFEKEIICSHDSVLLTKFKQLMQACLSQSNMWLQLLAHSSWDLSLCFSYPLVSFTSKWTDMVMTIGAFHSHSRKHHQQTSGIRLWSVAYYVLFLLFSISSSYLTAFDAYTNLTLHLDPWLDETWNKKSYDDCCSLVSRLMSFAVKSTNTRLLLSTGTPAAGAHAVMKESSRLSDAIGQIRLQWKRRAAKTPDVP